MERPSGVSKETQVSENKDEPVHCESSATIILDAPPSCIEFSRTAEDIFVVGTYSLVEAKDAGGSQARNGSLVLMRWDGEGLNSLQTHPTSSAVLDLHFSPHEPEVLAVATSTGAIEIFHLRIDQGAHLERFKTIQVFESTVLVLSFAWHPLPQALTTLAVSLSDGNLALVDYGRPTALIKRLEAHSLEAWTVVWSPESPTGDSKDSFSLYSGGDDSGLCTFSALQLPVAKEENEDADGVPDSEAWSSAFDSKIHGAGVTAILPLCNRTNNRMQNALLTGSYDEYVRILVEGLNGRWRSTAEMRLGGGVWRLKMISSGTVLAPDGRAEGVYHVLASCMHTGARILQIRVRDSGDSSIKVLAKFEEHESMNYGSDATFAREGDEMHSRNLLVVSTSFYDRKLCLWTFQVHINTATRFEIGRVKEAPTSAVLER